MFRKEARVATFPAPSIAGAGAQVGHIVALNEDGMLVVQLTGSRRTARLAVAIDAAGIEKAIEQRQPAVVVFENGDDSKPIVVGLIAPPVPAAAIETQPQPTIEADVDGRRVRLTAQDEIVLECGQASITLRRNGRVVIRGTHVESHSEGTNRIKGGQVRIN